MSFLSEIFGGGEARRDEQEARRRRELDFAYQEFEWKAAPLLATGELDDLKDLFVRYAVVAQMKNPGEEGEILSEFDRIVKDLMRKPRENVRRGWFDDF